MPNYRGLDTDIGWQKREFRKVWTAIREGNAAKRLRASSFAGLPAGTIPTVALAAPTAPGYVNLTATNFALSSSGANLISSTVSVPAGFDSCVVSLTGRVFAYNSTASDGYLYARPDVAGSTGNALPLPVAAAGGQADSGIAVATQTALLTGLSDTFTIRLWAATASGSWTADPAHTADLTGTLLWFT